MRGAWAHSVSCHWGGPRPLTDGQYYASASLAVTDSNATGLDDGSRRIVWAWVTEARGPPYGGSVWAGIQAMPREVTLGADGGLVFSPARELEAWRSNAAAPWNHVAKIAAGASNIELAELATSGMQLELRVEMDLSAPPTTGWNKTRP